MATVTPPDRPRAGSDFPRANAGGMTPKKAPKQILRPESEEGLDALDRPVVGLFFSILIPGGVVFVAILKHELARPEAQTDLA